MEQPASEIAIIRVILDSDPEFMKAWQSLEFRIDGDDPDAASVAQTPDGFILITEPRRHELKLLRSKYFGKDEVVGDPLICDLNAADVLSIKVQWNPVEEPECSLVVSKRETIATKTDRTAS